MNIVLTNDDGIDAPGLEAAYNAIRDFGTVFVVAPSSERSACSHTITLRTPINVERRHHPLYGVSYAVDGTPADCVRLAQASLIEAPIHMIVSGINHGANAGVDTFYSGTIAGAREGAILGIRSIALSQALRREVSVHWDATSLAARTVVERLIQESLEGPGFWSVNFPAPIPPEPGRNIHRVPVAVHPMPMTFDRKEDQDGSKMSFGYGASYWLREVQGPSDYSTIRDGGIAVTPIPLYGRF